MRKEEAGEMEATGGGGTQIDQQCIDMLVDSSISGTCLVLARTLLDYVGVCGEGACPGVFPSRVCIAIDSSIQLRLCPSTSLLASIATSLHYSPQRSSVVSLLWGASLSSQMSDPTVEIMEDVPPWCVSNFEFDDEDASFAIRCNGKLFYVDVSAEDLGDWSGKQEFLQLLQEVSDDFDVEESLYDLFSGPCIPLFRTYASVAEVTNPFTLQKYYVPEVLTFKLVGDGNDVKAVHCTENHQKTAKLAPQITLSEISDSSKVLHLDASTITIIPRDGPEADVTSDNPSTVSVDDTSTRYHFKPSKIFLLS
jgi:hypothetical protein